MASAKLKLLEPEDCVLLLIDHQPQMLFGVQSTDRTLLMNNVVALTKCARIFKVPTILTTVGATHFAGPIFPDIQAVFPEQKPIDRTTMNAWEDDRVVAAVKKTKRRRLLIAGLWTEICVAFPVLDAIKDGYDVYFVSDACGGVTTEAHEMAVQRMIQAGAVPLTWLVVMGEWQRDWARMATVPQVQELSVNYAGTYGQGLSYFKAMFSAVNEGARKEGSRSTSNPSGSESRTQH